MYMSVSGDFTAWRLPKKSTLGHSSVEFIAVFIFQWSKVTKIRTLPVVPGQANPPVLSKSHKPQPSSLDLRWGKLKATP